MNRFSEGTPASEVLEQHHARVRFQSVKGERANYKRLAEALYAELEIQKHRVAAIGGSLHAALSNYQAASQGLKQLQAAQDEFGDRLKTMAEDNAPKADEAPADTKGQ